MLRQKDVADCYYEQKKLKESLDEYKKVLAISSKIDDADQDALKETLGRIDELSHRLGIPTEDDLALQNETKKAVDRSYSWLPYALGGALFALLIIYLASARQNNDVDIVGKKTDKNR
jgi:tetratricopeptide (TPR) repeat protein